MARLNTDRDAVVVGELITREINRLVHEALGVEPCITACTHNIVASYTVLGLSNILGRAVRRLEEA